MPEGALIFEGRGKRVFQTEEPGRRRMEFTDSATTYDGCERKSFPAKGQLRNHISCALMGTLKENGVPTYFIRPQGREGMFVGSLGMFPMEVVCHNAAGGSFGKRLGLADGEVLPFTVVQFHLDRRGPVGQPLRNERLKETKTISEGDVKVMQARALQANRALKDLLFGKGFVLAELRLEFGRDAAGRVRIADDISPDTCRLWDRADHEKIDRDLFRTDVGSDEASYKKIARALTD